MQLGSDAKRLQPPPPVVCHEPQFVAFDSNAPTGPHALPAKDIVRKQPPDGSQLDDCTQVAESTVKDRAVEAVVLNDHTGPPASVGGERGHISCSAMTCQY